MTKKMDYPYQRKIYFTNLNISDACRLATALNKSIATIEMIKHGLSVIPTNDLNSPLVLNVNDGKRIPMWSPSLNELISKDWMVLD